MEKKKIFLIDDHPVFRFGLSQLINGETDLEVCAETGEAADAVPLIEEYSPDIAVVDITLNGRNGIDLLKQIHSNWQELLLLVVSMHEEDLYAQRVYQAGAKGYVQKDKHPKTIVYAIRHLLKGKQYWKESVVETFPTDEVECDGLSSQLITEKLADREYEIFCLIGQGHKPKQIAQMLSLSVYTVENHRTNIRQKLNIKDANQLTRLAYEFSSK